MLFNFPYEKNYCQYLELFNDTSNSVDLRNFKIFVQGYEIRITNLHTSEFETHGITNSFILQPQQVAVILPNSYSLSSKPFFFTTNTLILSSSTKYLGGNIPLNKDIVSSIKLLSNNVVVDQVNSTTQYDNAISFERVENNFIPTQTPSFGFVRNQKHIWFSKYLYSPNEYIEVFLRLNTNSSSVQVELIDNQNLQLTKVQDDVFRGLITPKTNSSKVIVRFEDIVSSVRVIDLFDTNSIFFENLLINEVCFLPMKRWLDHLLGYEASGKGREIDKYFEILNTTSETIQITSMYIHCLSRENEIYTPLGREVYYSSKRGIVSNITYILPYEYLIATTPNITSNMLFTLKDGHPYKGGRIIHFIEDRSLKLVPFVHSNYYIFQGKPTASVLPNGLKSSIGGRVLNWSETPGRYNGFRTPTIILDGKYKVVGSKLKIIIVDETLDTTTPIRIITRNSRITRSIVLTNTGLYYYGELTISTNHFDSIYVSESDEVMIEYSKSGEIFSETFFVIPHNSKEISTRDEVIIEKSILKYGDKIRFINVRRTDTITFFDRNGNFIRLLKPESEGVYEISSTSLVKNNLYFIVVERGNKKQFYKLVLLD
ncbi:MAG: hypothetical protein N3D81_00620 [Spirochaetes bacterium]|nr:hypothetical protein [Spirochaetota bacterium]